MKLSDLTVRKIITRICLLAVLAVAVLLIMTFGITKSTAAVVCVLITALVMSLFAVMMMLLFQKKLAAFTAEICQTLDEMIDGKAQLKSYTEEETLLARIVHQLEKLYLVMKHQKSSVDKERTELQELISDISHQTKTPITNLKMINDTLINENPMPEALKEFLQAALTQVDKLDFLVQAMVKTSRTIITTILSRRHEFATMQSIGMTSKQLTKMITFEGLYYALGACALGLMLSFVLGFTLIRGLTGTIWYFTFQFTLLPALLTCVVLLAMAAIVPTIALKTFNKGSIVEKMRVAG